MDLPYARLLQLRPGDRLQIEVPATASVAAVVAEGRVHLLADGCAHFEYAQRTPLPDLELLIR